MRSRQWFIGFTITNEGDKTAPIFSFLKLDKASSLNLSYTNLNNVSSECLKYKLDPFLLNMLYSGLKE